MPRDVLNMLFITHIILKFTIFCIAVLFYFTGLLFFILLSLMYTLLTLGSYPIKVIILFSLIFISRKILQLYYFNCVLSIVDHHQILLKGFDHRY